VDAASGKTSIIDVDLKAVRKGEDEDLHLQPNDVVMVSRRLI
jgi:hypothetical protein